MLHIIELVVEKSRDTSRLIRTPIHDKNGKLTTVYKRSGPSITREGVTFHLSSYEGFISQRDKMKEVMGDEAEAFITFHDAKSLREGKARVYLSEDRNTGFAITNKDELVNLFSLKPGTGAGHGAVIAAIHLGAKRLDCQEFNNAGKNLSGFYKKFGFEEEKREKNWTAGKPDVIYMGLQKKGY
jgi:hypothetical protein